MTQPSKVLYGSIPALCLSTERGDGHRKAEDRQSEGRAGSGSGRIVEYTAFADLIIHTEYIIEHIQDHSDDFTLRACARDNWDPDL